MLLDKIQMFTIYLYFIQTEGLHEGTAMNCNSLTQFSKATALWLWLKNYSTFLSEASDFSIYCSLPHSQGADTACKAPVWSGHMVWYHIKISVILCEIWMRCDNLSYRPNLYGCHIGFNQKLLKVFRSQMIFRQIHSKSYQTGFFKTIRPLQPIQFRNRKWAHI